MKKEEKDNFQYNDEHCGECGCGVECEDSEVHDENEETIMHLTLDDNTEVDCVVLGFFEVDEKEYVALLPEEEEDVLVYEYIKLENDEFDLKYIDSEEEFETVSEAFYTLFSDDEIENYDEIED